jgi:hypothetical protein
LLETPIIQCAFVKARSRCGIQDIVLVFLLYGKIDFEHEDENEKRKTMYSILIEQEIAIPPGVTACWQK